MSENLQKTALYDVHVAFGGRMVEFAGWSMPISFAGINQEHEYTRTVCSLFDVSHMGRLIINGKDAEPFLNRLCTRNLTDAEVGRSYYSHMCREDGGILDDLIVSRFEANWGVICNASNRDKIVSWMERQKSGFEVDLHDETSDTVMIALQGPRAMEAAADIAKTDFSTLKRYRFTSREVLGARISIYRSGYTGEDGLEVVAPAGLVRMFSSFLVGTPDKPHSLIKPAGLGARDTLRIEAGMPLYGHELSEDWDSLTAGQAWCVDLSKDFIGAEAMRGKKDTGLERQMIGLELEGRRIARQHHDVYAGDKIVGEVTSGTLSPTLGKSIAMALVETGSHEIGTELEVSLGQKRVTGKVVKLPFYKRPK
ncbi:MAG: glycine cleavage system aminomethyltransferase GcvT [Planctomycetota bacterium]|jgi:aminomethyltransferase